MYAVIYTVIPSELAGLSAALSVYMDTSPYNKLLQKYIGVYVLVSTYTPLVNLIFMKVLSSLYLILSHIMLQKLHTENDIL